MIACKEQTRVCFHEATTQNTYLNTCRKSVAVKIPSLQHGPEPDVSKFFSSYKLVTARGLTMWFH